MNFVNLIFLLSGIIALIIGLAAFINPAITRFINSPGGPRIKAIVAMSVGIGFILLALFVDMPL